MAIEDVLVGVAIIKYDDGAGFTGTIGYTSDGCTLTISTDFADIKVEELSGTIKRVITDQQAKLTLNLAENTLTNMMLAIPGSKLNGGGTILTLGGQPLLELEIEMEVPHPEDMASRTITLEMANPTGEVGMSYRKGEATLIPITFSVLIKDDGKWGEIEDIPT